MSEVTEILTAIERGDSAASRDLLPLVYDELRKLAAEKIVQERPGQTLQPTALVHEAYLRLVGNDSTQIWNGRNHFFAAAAEAMRRILIESARGKRRLKRGGGRKRVALDDPADEERETNDELLALEEALLKLAEEDAIAARVVELRRFAGMDQRDVADVLGISVYRARQKWTYARAWLRHALRGEADR